MPWPVGVGAVERRRFPGAEGGVKSVSGQNRRRVSGQECGWQSLRVFRVPTVGASAQYLPAISRLRLKVRPVLAADRRPPCKGCSTGLGHGWDPCVGQLLSAKGKTELFPRPRNSPTRGPQPWEWPWLGWERPWAHGGTGASCWWSRAGRGLWGAPGCHRWPGPHQRLLGREGTSLTQPCGGQGLCAICPVRGPALCGHSCGCPCDQAARSKP